MPDGPTPAAAGTSTRVGLLGGLDLEQTDDGLAPDREHPTRQPAIQDERPMELHREKLLRNPETMPPFVEGHLQHLEDRRGYQQKKRPRKSLIFSVDRWQAIPPVQIRTHRQRDRQGKPKVEHGDVRRGQRRITHHRLMPRPVPVRPEAGHNRDGQARRTHQAPQHRQASDLFLARQRLLLHFQARANEPAEPRPCEETNRDELRPEQRAIVRRELRTGRVQPGREHIFVVPYPEKCVDQQQQSTAVEQRPPSSEPIGRPASCLFAP
jgi:hypothetical protein